MGGLPERVELECVGGGPADGERIHLRPGTEFYLHPYARAGVWKVARYEARGGRLVYCPKPRGLSDDR